MNSTIQIGEPTTSNEDKHALSYGQKLDWFGYLLSCGCEQSEAAWLVWPTIGDTQGLPPPPPTTTKVCVGLDTECDPR